MAIPTLAMIPSGYKAGKLYSVLSSDGTGDFTVARNSVATRVNQSGLIEEVDVNVPRLDYSAGGCPVLLTEIESQNKITYSEDFSNAAWDKTNLSLTSNSIISPSGVLNSTKLIPNATSSQHKIDITRTVTNGASVSLSAFVKKGEYKFCCLYEVNSVKGRFFDLSNGTQGGTFGTAPTTSNIENYGADWYRVSITTTVPSTSARYILYVCDTISNTSFLGDATSGIHIWGAQLEEQPAATSYIKSNSGSATTREADLVNGAGSAATFNSLEHTFFIDLNSVFENAAFSSISIVGSTGNVSDNRIMIFKRPSDSQVTLETRSGGSTVATETLSNIDFSLKQKLAITIKENEVKYYRNGFLVATDTGTIALPLSLGQITLTSGTTGDKLFASTKDIRYYNQVLTEAETLELMSYDSFNEMASALQYTIK